MLTAAAADEVALAPPGQPFTAFSDALCRLLTDGNPVGRPWISLEDVFLYLRRELPARGIPAPRRSQNGVVGRLVLAANPAASPAPVPPVAAPRPEPGDNESPCPYLGLSPYTSDDARDFFGRHDTVDKVLERISLHIDDGPLILIGVSGVGKSSLMAAGVVPAIRRGELPVAKGWPTLTCTPGPQPLETLAARLAVAADIAVDSAVASLWADPYEVEDLILKGLQREASATESARMVLVVDQFEELFTLCDDLEERRRFVAILDRAGRSGAMVVLTLRADFYPQCMAHPELVDALAHRQIPIEPMSSAHLREVVEAPAALTGLILEAGLLNRLLEDLAGSDFSDASLPLLSYSMQQTWIRRDGDTLTLAGYEATGGIRDAVTRQADAAFDSLGPAGQNAMRRLLLRMVRVGTDVEDTRRTVDLGELLRDNPAETRWIAAARDALAERRLIVVADQHAWITHDALLRAWPRLRRWIDEDRDGLVLHHRLIDDAQTWHRSGEGLYRGQRLAAARAWSRSHPNQLGPLEQRFLRAATRGRRRSLAGTAAAAMAAVLAVVATVIAINQHRSDMRAATITNSRKLAQTADGLRTTDPVTAEQLSLAAYRIAPTPEARAAVLASDSTPLPVDIPSHGGKDVVSLAMSPDNKILVSTGADHTIRLWDIADARHPKARAVIANDSPAVAAFVPGTRLLVDQTRSALQIWDLTNPATPAKRSEIATSLSVASGVALSPDGRTVATCGTNGIVRLWAIDDPDHPVLATERHVNPEMLLSIAFDRHGTTLAIGSGAARISGPVTGQADLLLWNVTDRTHPRPLSTQPATSVEALAFSPTEDKLVAVGGSASMLILDLTAPDRPIRLCDQSASGEPRPPVGVFKSLMQGADS